VFTLSGAVGKVASLTGSGGFPNQAANTVGAPQSFTVTNGGSDPVDIGKVHVTGAGADDFLISQDNCGNTTLPALAAGDATPRPARSPCGTRRRRSTRRRARRSW